MENNYFNPTYLMLNKPRVIIKEELNVKKVTYEADLSNFINFNIVSNFKTAGPIFGSKIYMFREYLTTLSDEEVYFDIEKIA